MHFILYYLAISNNKFNKNLVNMISNTLTIEYVSKSNTRMINRINGWIQLHNQVKRINSYTILLADLFCNFLLLFYFHKCIYVFFLVYLYIYACVCVFVCICIHMCVFVCICMYMCVYSTEYSTE